MADPFELWRLMWSTAISHGLEQFAEASSGTAALARRCQIYVRANHSPTEKARELIAALTPLVAKSKRRATTLN